MSAHDEKPTLNIDSAVGFDLPDMAGVEHPRQLGPYTILSMLGQGGMGIVYVAEQRHPVHRRVAIKLIKAGMDTHEVIARFEAERQAVALMDHPNIARVFDAGATEHGRPYFVMELVAGVPITRFCDDEKLSTRARLELFATICDAMQHAHTKGIIHRDLKPANILVARADGRPVPKIIDFGVAKAVNRRLTERTLFTHYGTMVGTPEYMSPEQAENRVTEIDARSDVYSLGVMLYELLTGALPFDPTTLRANAYAEMQRILREVEPPRPSTRLTRMGADAHALARHRRESVATLAWKLRNELEWIPIKAMRKEPSQRYRTASEMADDIRNYLSGRPLIAGPESNAYRARKFLRRNRAAVIAAAIMLLLLVGGIVGTSYQAWRAGQQRALAQRRFDDVRELARKLLFDLHPDVDKLAGSTSAVRKIVDMSLQYLSRLQAESSGDYRLVREVALAYGQLGDIQGNPNYNNLGDTRGAAESYEQMRRMAEQAVAMQPDSADAIGVLASAHLKMGDVLEREGKRTQALQQYEIAQTGYERAAKLEPNSAVASYNPMVALRRMADLKVEMGDVHGTVELLSRNLKRLRELVARFPDERRFDARIPGSLLELARAQRRAGNPQAAAESLRESIAGWEALVKSDPDNAHWQGALGDAYGVLCQQHLNDERDLVAADRAIDKALVALRKAYRDDPQNTQALQTLGSNLILRSDVYIQQGRLDEAQSCTQETIELYNRGLATTPTDRLLKQMLIVTYGGLGDLQDKRGDHLAAVASRRTGLEMLKPIVAADPGNAMLQAGIGYTHSQIAGTQALARDYTAALESTRLAISIFENLIQANPADGRLGNYLLKARKTRLQALDGLVTDRATTPEARLAYRQEGRTLIQRIREGTRDDADELNELDQALKDLDDDSRVGLPPATAPM